MDRYVLIKPPTCCLCRKIFCAIASSVLYVFLPISVHFIMYHSVRLSVSVCCFCFSQLVSLLFSDWSLRLSAYSILASFCLSASIFFSVSACVCLPVFLSLSLSLGILYFSCRLFLPAQWAFSFSVSPACLSFCFCLHIFSVSERLSIAELSCFLYLVSLNPSTFSFFFLPVGRLDSSLFRPRPSSARLSFRAVVSLLS